MPSPRAPRRLPSAALPMLAALAAIVSLPAQAEFYFRPFGGVYVERYYEPLPPGGYYPPPPPVYRPSGRFPFADVNPMLGSMGMTAIGRARVDGDTYVVDATDRSGRRVRVRIDAFNGRVIAMHPVGQPSLTRQAPALLAVPPLPPARPPEIATVATPAPSDPGTPVGPGASATVPAAASPAEEAGTVDSPAPTAVRVIPGVAVPPGTAPDADAQAPAGPPLATPPAVGSGTGTGTGTGSDTPAGTASVVVRGAGGPPSPAAD